MNSFEKDVILNTILEAHKDFVFTFTLSKKFSFANKHFLDLTGLTLNEIIGKDFLNINLKPEVAVGLYAALEKAIETKCLVKAKSLFASIHGDNVFYEYFFSPVFNDDNKFMSIAALARRISGNHVDLGSSDDVQTTKWFPESEEKYRTLFNMMDQGFCIVEMIFDAFGKPIDYRFLEVNQMFEKQTGLTNATGNTARQLIPALESHWVENYGKVALTGEAIRFTEGSEAMGRWFDVFAFKFPPAESRLVAILFTDITERKKSEAQLIQSENNIRRITDSVPALISVVDRDLRYQFVSSRYKDWFGWDPQQMVGKTLYEILGEKAVMNVLPYIERALEGEELTFESKMPYLNGLRHIKANFVPQASADGGIIGYYALVTDISEQKEFENALLESETRFRTMAESSDLLIATSNETSNADYFNKKWAEFTGRSIEDLRNFGWADLIHEEDRQDFIDVYLSAFKNKEPWRREFRMLNSEGEYRWLLAIGPPRFHTDGTFAGYISSCIDITERKQAEEEIAFKEESLRKSEGHLRALISATSDIIYTMNADWSEMGILQGKVFVPDIGAPRRDWFENNIPAADHHLVRNAIDEAIKSKSVFQLEHRVRLADGGIGWTFSRAIPILDSEGVITEWLGAASDVTERKRAEITLLESENKLRGIMDNAPLAIGLFVGKEMVIENPNQTFIDILGKGEGIVGLPLQDALPELVTEDQPFLKILDEVYMTGIPFSTDGTTIKIFRNGEMTNNYYNFSYTPIYNDERKIYAIVVIAKDVTEQILASQRLRESESKLEAKNKELIKINNDLDNFIYTASHDLKAPVSNIEGLVNSLKDSLPPAILSEDMQGILEMIDNSVTRFKNTILDLTEISKIHNELEEGTDLVNIDEVLDDVKLSINDKIIQSNAIIKMDTSKVSTLKFSKKNFQSIVYNLLSNAVKYKDSIRRPEVFISTEVGEGFLILTVMDNGLGMSEANQSKMFSMFKRFHDHVEGTGIGLYIVKRIMDNAGGKIEVKSEIGKGTTFHIYFPI